VKTEIIDTRDFLQDISDWIRFFVRDTLSGGWIMQFFFKFLFWAALIYLVDLVCRLAINFFYRFISNPDKYPILTSIRESKVTNSVAHLIALQFGSFSLYSIFYVHTQNYPTLERIIGFCIVIALAGFAFRALKAVEYYHFLKKDHYQLMALRAISQTVKIFGTLIFSIIALCVISGVSGTMVLGSLGAITAVLVLVFRDTILGFVTGIHVATSKNLKVGDWISIPKYSLEGTIEDINLLTTKILNFDKTVSTIPTYDLLSTEIKNLQVMSETNTRRIKKSIIFNIKSFEFLDQEAIERLKKIDLIREYLDHKTKELDDERKTQVERHEILNGKQLTNIGTFRVYALNYLKSSPKVDQSGMLLVRQLDITPQGLPLEIYCFANDSRLQYFEQIQADIFDHLLVASREFNLEVMQVSIKV